LILSLIGLRELIFNSISPSLKNGIAAGIGLFIAFIGLQQAGVIVKDPGTAVRMNTHLASPDLIVFFVGVLATAVLHTRRVRGSILWGIIIATRLACLLKITLPYMPAGVSAAR
jgi:adenine/guanine/hypoxanthine permease